MAMKIECVKLSGLWNGGVDSVQNLKYQMLRRD